MAIHPLIGITTYGRDLENKFYLPAPYMECVRRAGGLPVLLPHGEPRLEELAARMAGLILSGGGDIDPARYGGRGHEQNYMVDGERDEMELALVQEAVRTKMPLFGICRGAQVINVALGGTLIEHLPDAVGNTVTHRKPPRLPTQHAVRLRPGTRLAQMIGRGELTGSSWHHQGIGRLAEGLRESAFAADDTIEAVEMPEERHPWFIGVQWHPELTAKDDPLQQRLFDSFVAACVGRDGGA